jgi:2-polyprenyl-3-methyl-5-hydroxy-6-metoxy-1,4-benzoquinol methylase
MVASIYDERLVDVVGSSFDCIVALKLIEHLMPPARLFSQAFPLLRPTGHLIVSTPYHFAVGWDGGHVKLFSRRTLRNMSHGFHVERTVGAGRIFATLEVDDHGAQTRRSSNARCACLTELVG